MILIRLDILIDFYREDKGNFVQRVRDFISEICSLLG